MCSSDLRERFPELEARLGAPLPDYAPPAHWARKQLRSMGRVSQLCVDAAEQALQNAGLLGNERIKDGRMGVACGSSTGSTKDIGDLGELLLTGTSRNFNANTYVRMMPQPFQGRLRPVSPRLEVFSSLRWLHADMESPTPPPSRPRPEPLGS